MKIITIQLPDDVAHRLEVCAAKDDIRLAEGITRLLVFLVEMFEGRKHEVTDAFTVPN